MIAIILHSGEWDRIYHGLSLASMYSALEKKVVIFLTYWSLKTVVEGGMNCGDKEKDEIMKKAYNNGKVKDLTEMVEMGKAFGNLEIVACSGSMEILGIKDDDMPNWVDRVGGLGEILMNADNVIFI